MMTEKDAEVMRQIFIWAYRNQIDVELRSVFTGHYDGGSHPEMVFRKNGNSIGRAFYSFLEVGEHFKHGLWKELGIKLCVQPFEFKEPSP